MQDKRSSTLWIIRYINILFLLRRELAKPFRDATKEDIRNLLKNIEKKGYAFYYYKRQSCSIIFFQDCIQMITQIRKKFKHIIDSIVDSELSSYYNLLAKL